MVQLCCFLRSMTGFCAAVILATSLTMNPGQAHADSRIVEAEDFISSLIEDIRITVEADAMTEDKKIAAINAIVDSYFDVDGITRFSAGRYWRAASSQQRKQYTRQFRNVLINTARRQFDQILGLTFTPTL